jgi:CheY-like chemotaxis protein
MPIRRILIVDDNEDHARTLTMLCEATGREVQYATNPLYALDLVTRWVPDVIFLDISMPQMDGYQAASRFRRALPRVRLYAVTGYGAQNDRSSALAAGFDEHFTKPVAWDRIEPLL